MLCSQDLLYSSRMLLGGLEGAMCTGSSLLQQDATKRTSVLCAQDLLYSSMMLLSGLECAMFTGPSLLQQDATRRFK